jgi:hypothetical protein
MSNFSDKFFRKAENLPQQFTKLSWVRFVDFSSQHKKYSSSSWQSYGTESDKWAMFVFYYNLSQAVASILAKKNDCQMQRSPAIHACIIPP